MSDERLRAFVRESNRIEGIDREAHASEIEAHEWLLSLDAICADDLTAFVETIADAPLRDREGMDVRVGSHLPPRGGLDIARQLDIFLEGVNDDSFSSPYNAHHAYEKLHPFMDGNGRSGRVLWAWMMLRDGHDPFALPFLHRWYYQSLDAGRVVGVTVAGEVS